MAGKILVDARARTRQRAGPARIDESIRQRTDERSIIVDADIRTGLVPTDIGLDASIIEGAGRRHCRPMMRFATAAWQKKIFEFPRNRTPSMRRLNIDAPRYLESHNAINSNLSIGQMRYVIHENNFEKIACSRTNAKTYGNMKAISVTKHHSDNLNSNETQLHFDYERTNKISFSEWEIAICCAKRGRIVRKCVRNRETS